MSDKIREKLNLTKEQAREITWGDSEDFEIISDQIISNTRWSIHHWIIVKRKSDGKYFADRYSLGATERIVDFNKSDNFGREKQKLVKI